MRFSRAFLVALASAAFAPSCFSFVASPSLPHALQRTTTRLVNDGIRDHRAHYAASQGQRLDMSGTINNRDDKNSTRRRRAIVVVGLNGALQRTIVFKPPKGLRVGDVNRASSVGAGIGGKGQNVCVALRTLAEGEDREDVDVTLAHFAGGKSGEQCLQSSHITIYYTSYGYQERSNTENVFLIGSAHVHNLHNL